MCALVFTQVSFLCVQSNFWASFTHNSLDVIWIFCRNLIANWFDSLIRCNLEIRIEWAVTITSASALPVTISLPSTHFFLRVWSALSFSFCVHPFIVETVWSWTKCLANALAERIAPLRSLTVISWYALTWTPLIVSVDMAAASEFGTVTYNLQMCDENIFSVDSFLWKVRSVIEV